MCVGRAPAVRKPSPRRAHPSSPAPLRTPAPHTQTWYNEDQRLEFWATLNKYETLAVLVGHTHGAAVYSFNGTSQGPFGSTAPGAIDVINAPATQKEDGKFNALPSEFMAVEASVDTATGKGVLRVAQRVGSAWGTVQGMKSFQC